MNVSSTCPCVRERERVNVSIWESVYSSNVYPKADHLEDKENAGIR